MCSREIEKGAQPEAMESKNQLSAVLGEVAKPKGQLEAPQAELKRAAKVLMGLLPLVK